MRLSRLPFLVAMVTSVSREKSVCTGDSYSENEVLQLDHLFRTAFHLNYDKSIYILAVL